MKLNYSILILFITIFSFSYSQSIGDTIKVQAFDYSSPTRDIMVNFPSSTSTTYEKVIMKYNMRCKNAAVSNSSNRNLGCGEWDYSCNTYLHDSLRFDSTSHQINDYSISNFFGTTYNYSSNPIYDYYQKIEKLTSISSTITESLDTLGNGIATSEKVINSNFSNSKSQYLFTVSELLASGVLPGNIDALFLDLSSIGSQLGQLKIKMKSTSRSVIEAISIDLLGFTEVFYHTTNFSLGNNRLQFHTPFNWDGISNIIVEFSFTNLSNGTPNKVKGSFSTTKRGLHLSNNKHFSFDGTNYMVADRYRGVPGSNNRTMEMWIKGTSQGELVSWGNNSTGTKWNFRVEGAGRLRLEVNGGGTVGTTNVLDNQWHHVACVFNGTTLADVNFYVDGVLDTRSSVGTSVINTDTVGAIKVNINKGIHNRYFIGQMDDIRIWEDDLSVATLDTWKRKKVDNSHPNYSTLQSYYLLNEGTGSTVYDSSFRNDFSSIYGANSWLKDKGEFLFNEIEESTFRPNIVFAQGIYVLNTVNDTIYDSIAHAPNFVINNSISQNVGQKKNDDIIVVSSTNYWNSDFDSYYYDENGMVYDTVVNVPDGTFTVTPLNYQKRFPKKFEIMSFVTPYGINLDLGVKGKTWTFDMTDYLPIMKGTKRITMERGGQFQEEMDIQFLFIVGTPVRDVLDIDELWTVNSINYTDIISDKYFAPKTLPMLSTGKYFKVRSSISGHGQEGEFIPQNHYFNMNGGANEFTWQVWKDCGNNPVYPQGGTWIYDRAGWCPGMATDIKHMDVTSHITPGNNATFDYGITTATGTSRYIVSNQLVTYSEFNHNTDATLFDVISPSNKIEYGRQNDICNDPTIVIQNTGKNNLTSLVIEYWINNNTVKETYTWTGLLQPLEKQEVVLPTSNNLWSTVVGVDNIFNVEISNPNSTTDEYLYNNRLSSNFKAPRFLPSQFEIRYRSNNAANETSFEVIDEIGNVIHTNSGQANSVETRKTLNLGLGCYKLKIVDTDGDGIGFWANSDGSGYLRIHASTGQALWTLNPDFGSIFELNFTINSPLSLIDNGDRNEIYLFPNPAKNKFSIEAENLNNATVTIKNLLGEIVEVPNTLSTNKISFDSSNLPKGVYLVSIKIENILTTKKVVIQ